MFTLIYMHRIVLKPGAIWDHCKEKGISRDALSREMKVSTATAYRVDAGKVDPSPSFIAALINVTGKTFEDLFDIVREDAA